MNNITLIEQNVNGKTIIMESVRNIAEIFGKRTADIMRKIREIMDIDNDCENALVEIDDMILLISDYKDKKGELRKEYLVNEGLFLELVMGFTGKKARALRVSYREQFNAMKEHLQNIALQSPQTFVSTIPAKLSKTEIIKYLSYCELNRDTAKQVLAPLLEELKNRKGEGENKKLAYTTIINTLDEKINTTTDMIERAIFDEYRHKAEADRYKVCNSQTGGLVTSNKYKENRIKELEDELELAKVNGNSNSLKEKIALNKSFNNYAKYIISHSTFTGSEVYRGLFGLIQNDQGIIVNAIPKDNETYLEALYDIDPEYARDLVFYAKEKAVYYGYKVNTL